MNLFVRAMLLGSVISIPFGPMGIFCIEQILNEGRKRGLFLVLGIITSDLIYFSIGLVFMSTVEDMLLPYKHIISFILGIILIFVGYRKYMSPVKEIASPNLEKSLLQNYFKGMMFAIFNISGLFTICALLTLLNIAPDTMRMYPFVLIGSLTGELLVWNLSIYILTTLRKNISRDHLIIFSQYSGLAFIFFGVIITIRVLYSYILYA